MLMVVFGAGASFDSDPNRPARGIPSGEEHRPPLADQLFDDRPIFTSNIERFPACQPVIPYLRERGSKTVEQVLGELQAEGEGYRRRLSQLAAIRWYLRAMLAQCTANWLATSHGLSNHKTLFDQIEQYGRPDEGVCLVTFNYDLLIERALESLDIYVSDIPDYIRNDRYKLFKLHGSINWSRDIELPTIILFPVTHGDGIANTLIQRAADLKIRAHYVSDAEIVPSDPKFPRFPAIAIPVEDKRDFECPPEHLDALESCLPRVTRMLTVGWRATEKPFLDLLKRHFKYKQKLMVVAQDLRGAETTITNIRNAGVPLQEDIVRPYSSTFTDFVVNRAGENFLQIG